MPHARLVLLLACLATATCAAAPPADRAPAPALRLLVPAYFYPSGDGRRGWDRLAAAARRVPVTAIVDPANGPGKDGNANYTEVLAKTHRAGVTLIGYVTTSYGKRTAAEVEADVDTWLRLYPGVLGGIFFDEQASDAAHVEYQAELYRYVRQQPELRLVVTNPGTVCDEGYLKAPAADSTCLFEGPKQAASFRFPGWVSRYKQQRITGLAYQVPDAAAMRSCIRDAQQQRIGYTYVTDAAGVNPWDRLPAYWDQEVATVERVNRR